MSFAFSSAVNFSLAGVSATGGTLSNLAGSGKSWSATYTALAGVDIANATVSVKAGSWTDASGIAGLGASTPAFTVARCRRRCDDHGDGRDLDDQAGSRRSPA